MTARRGFYVKPAADCEMKIYAVDLDDTIAEGTWHPTQAKSVIGEPKESIIWWVNRWYGEGAQIIIHTARSWSDKPLIEAWLQTNEVPYHAVVCGKLLANYYIDDKAISVRELESFDADCDLVKEYYAA